MSGPPARPAPGTTGTPVPQRGVAVLQPGEHAAIEVHVDGERWLTVATVEKRGRGWRGPDWAATRARAEAIAAALRLAADACADAAGETPADYGAVAAWLRERAAEGAS